MSDEWYFTHLQLTPGAGLLCLLCRLSVTVIYDKREDRDEWASDFCQEKGWNYKDYFDMMGCEDECIIAMDCPVPEAASRPHNSYLICTNIIIE